VTFSHQPAGVKKADTIVMVPHGGNPTSATTTANNVPHKLTGSGAVKQHGTVVPVPKPKPVFVAQLHDGSVVVGKESGKLSVRANGRELEAELARLVGPKLRDGSIKSEKYVLAPFSRLRDPGAEKNHINLERLSPTPGAPVDTRPELKWQPVDGASSYRVEIYDAEGNTISLPETTETSIRPSEKLAAGAYYWIVWVERGAMAEPRASNSASFIVLSAHDKALIARAKRDYPKSHVVLGTVYESLGLDKDAVREFQALAAQNPGSPIADRLLAGAKNNLKD
jgi:hypothetical protein